MASRNHKQTASNGLKNALPHVRPSRPAPLPKRNTYHGHASSSNTHGSGWNKKSTMGATNASSSAEDDISSFLQFCATCEKQIVTPNFSMLYCSEACRKRDSVSSTYCSSEVSPSTAVHPEYPHKNIMPQRSPTIVRPLSNNFSELSLSEASPRSSSSTWDDQEPHSQALPGFPYHAASSPTIYRTDYKRMSSTTEAPPSLSHSPSSSYGTIASCTSTRPLAPKHSHNNTKSVDLVTPVPFAPPTTSPILGPRNASLKSQASTLTTLRVAEAVEGDISHDNGHGSRFYPQRKESGSGIGQAVGSLKQLFSHNAIRAAPRKST